MTRPAIAAIVGPTASGKSALALAVASHVPIEIISADSRQVYRGMDIGTAKPTPAERAAVPHHLLDVVAPDQPFTVAEWVAQVQPLIEEVTQRGRLPLIVGGTGLYLSALVDGYDLDAQAWSPDIRARLAAEVETDGLAPLAARLGRLAPEVAAGIDLRNPRRVLRALERAEGGDLARPRADPYPGALHLIALERPRDVLTRRIAKRAQAMFDGGLLAETQALLAAGYDGDLPSLSGHGYREAIDVLTGTLSEAEAVESTSRRVRQYAKRQLTWFRRDARITWLSAGDGPVTDPRLLDTVLRLLPRVG